MSYNYIYIIIYIYIYLHIALYIMCCLPLYVYVDYMHVNYAPILRLSRMVRGVVTHDVDKTV